MGAPLCLYQGATTVHMIDCPRLESVLTLQGPHSVHGVPSGEGDKHMARAGTLSAELKKVALL